MCLDTTILHYIDKEDKAQDREKKAEEAIQAYYKRKKQEKMQTTSINLK